MVGPTNVRFLAKNQHTPKDFFNPTRIVSSSKIILENKVIKKLSLEKNVFFF